MRARKCCRNVDGLMCARCAKSSPCSGWAKFCLSQATTFAICCPGDPAITRWRSCGPCGPVSSRTVISCWMSGASRGTKAGSSKRFTSRVRASSNVGVQCFERDRSLSVVSSGPRCVHLGSHLQNRADIERQHQTEKRFAGARSRDMRHDREIDRRQHGLPRTVVDRLFANQYLLVALRNHSETQVVDAVQGLGWCGAAVQFERGNGSVVVAVGLCKPLDGANQWPHRKTVSEIWPCWLWHLRIRQGGAL